jgi:sulfite exporter TauE/SafE
MTELPLIALGGVLGSAHCVGMCGGFALTVGLGASRPADNLVRQLLYSFGRIFTYGFLGASAGYGGFWFAGRSSALVHAQAVLSILAGVLLVAQGLSTLGLLPRPSGRWFRAVAGSAPCLAGSLVGPLFTSPRRRDVFAAGVLNGLLPCGLVYGYLALASSTASLPRGLATMASFGLGTIPVMVLTGLGATVLPPRTRRRLFRLAGACVLLTGVLALSRGAEFWHSGDPARCPGCEAAARAGR